MTTAATYHTRRRTSRKTLNRLLHNGFQPEIVGSLKTPPSRADIAALIADDDALPDDDALAPNPIRVEPAVVVTAEGTRPAWPVDAVHEIP